MEEDHIPEEDRVVVEAHSQEEDRAGAVAHTLVEVAHTLVAAAHSPKEVDCTLVEHRVVAVHKENIQREVDTVLVLAREQGGLKRRRRETAPLRAARGSTWACNHATDGTYTALARRRFFPDTRGDTRQSMEATREPTLVRELRSEPALTTPSRRPQPRSEPLGATAQRLSTPLAPTLPLAPAAPQSASESSSCT